MSDDKNRLDAPDPRLIPEEPKPKSGRGVPRVRTSLVVPSGEFDPVNVPGEPDKSPASEQLALSIFSDMKDRGLDFEVQESQRDFGYRKSVVLLDSRDLTVVSRRLINALFYVVASNPNHTRYDLDLVYVLWLMRFNSRNLDPIKKAITQCQKTLVQAEKLVKAALPADELDSKPAEHESWGSVQLIGETIVGGGRISVVVPRAIRKALANPKIYTYLSIRVCANLTSTYATALYERLSMYAYRGTTDWIDVEDFRMWFRGDDGSPFTKEWKSVKRDVIDVAIEQINRHTDLLIDASQKTSGKGRKISHVLFTITTKPGFFEGSERQEQIFHRLQKECGLTREQIFEVMDRRQEWDDEYIERAIEFVDFRVRTAPASKPVVKPGGLLMMALREGLALSDQERITLSKLRGQTPQLEAPSRNRRTKADPAKTSSDLFAREIAEDARASIDWFEQLDETEQLAWLAQFQANPTFKLSCTRAKIDPANFTLDLALTDEKLRKSFGAFLNAARRS